MLPPSAADVLRAGLTIRPFICRTPLRHAPLLSADTCVDLWLKLENWQPTGSFKLRGALNVMASLSPARRSAGLVTASAGNHALAVAYAAVRLGLANVTLFVPETAPRAKLDKLRLYPVHLVVAGRSYDEAHTAAQTFQRETGATFVHAYDDPVTIAGQGTLGFEVLQDLPSVQALLVPVGGGGLIGGISLAVKSILPTVRVIGVQPEASPALRDSLRDGHAYEDYPAGPTIADGLSGGIGLLPFKLAQKYVDDVLVVSESAVRAAVGALVSREQLLVEGSGAVGVAALLTAAGDSLRGLTVAAILTGANIDPAVLAACLQSSI